MTRPAHSLSTILAIARYELRVVLRNRWILIYASIFAVLTMAVSYFGLAVIEFTGFQNFNRTAVSLLNLVLYIVPLATMLMGVQSFRAEGGATDQLFTEPVLLSEVVLGKLVGLSVAHILSVTLGFSVTGIMIAGKTGRQGINSYLALVGFTMVLGLVFLSMSTLLTVISKRGHRAYAVVLTAWFFLVLLFDLMIIGLSFLLPELWANRTAFAAVFLNPVDAIRVATLLTISGREMFGPAGAQLVRGLGGTTPAILLLLATLAAWIVVPAALSIRSLKRQDL